MEKETSAAIQRNRSCPCKSGRRYKDCCGRDILARGAVNLAEARRRLKDGDIQAARKICRQTLQQAPDHIETLKFLADLEVQAGELAAATRLRQHLVELRPKNDAANCDLANVLHKRRQLKEAEKYARQAVAINPNNAQAHNLVGMILADSHRYEEAEVYYREVLKLHVPVAGLCANLAAMKVKLGKLDEAENLYRETLRLEPGNIDGLLDWIRLRESRQDLPGAWHLMNRAMQLRPDYLPCYLAQSALYRREKNFAAALAALEQGRNLKTPEAAGAVSYLDQRGTVFDKLGRYDEAFRDFTTANETICRTKKVDYDREHVSKQINDLKLFFTRANMAQLPRPVIDEAAENGRAQPIFIIGFPRSGTTLVEQILGAHPMITAGDELPFIWRLTRILQGTLKSRDKYPECLAVLKKTGQQEMLNKLRSYYLVNVESRAIADPGSHYFTDKMPLNETNLGLINLLFPEAPIVHLIRHPLDVVLSTFFTDLTHGNFCSYKLETAAFHYRLIFDLLEHYRANLQMRYLPVRYEEVVQEPEMNVRRLLEFIGEPYDERCLQFHKSHRVARTASYAQVTEKMHTRSVYRFRNYRRHLEGIMPLLQPAIESLGYPLD